MMLSALASADGFVWLSICVKALAYAATLVAAGSALVLIGLRNLDEALTRYMRRLALGAAVLAAVVSLARIPIQASFLAGGTLDGATDPMLLGLVADSPFGASIYLRVVGLGLICGAIVPHRLGLWGALAGAAVASGSFAFRGHALEEPRVLLGGMITLHMMGLAFWIGAFAPLHRAARSGDPEAAGALAHEFGQKALWTVAALFIAGGVTLVILTGGSPLAFFSPYGQFFALKLVVFLGVLGLAGLNKLSLTPALNREEARAGSRLRRSIRLEAGLVALILLVTAALTTLTSPPREEPASNAYVAATPRCPVCATGAG